MAQEEPAKRAPGVGVVVALLGAIALVQWWAQHASDPDLFLPDPFRGVVIVSVLLFAVALCFRRRMVRRAFFTLSISIPVLVVLAEVWQARRPVDTWRIAVSADPLLRFTYRPGVEVSDRVPGATPMNITADGLWDVSHPVPRPPGTRRVVVLGDSVPNDPTIAFARRFPHRLQELLSANAPPGQSCDVVNVSCEGFNTIQEVRLYEQVGRRYQPDLIVVAYVLNDPFMQNGAYRRLGNSFFAFRFAPLLGMLTGRSICSMFQALDRGYGYEIVVRNSLERLRMIAAHDGTRVLMAPLPIVAPFDDPSCISQYDHVLATARDEGFATTRVVDAFRGEAYQRFLKADARFDVTHPNVDGHERIAQHLARVVSPMLWPASP